MTDCATPATSFALLCDVYEYLAENHADAPLDAEALAAGFALGIGGYEETAEIERIESFQCAVPSPAFETSCELLSERLVGSGISLEGAVEAGVSSMIALSLDPFTYYIPPELSGALTPDGVIAAVGLLVTIADPVGSVCTLVQDPCQVEVVTVIEDGPAHTAGLRVGDVITAIDGETVAGADLVEIAQRLDGNTGTSVTVDLRGPNDDARTLSLERSQPIWPEFELEVPRTGVGYLRIPDFSMETPVVVHSALESLTASGVDDLVIDLRDNPGGFVDAVTLVASEFLSAGLVFRSLGPAGDLDYPVQPGGVATSGPDITVVVNGGSASASEILAGVLQERGRARVVGTPTFGKDTVQIGFLLRNDGVLRVTVAHWVTPEGESVAAGGVAPDAVVDIPVDATPAEVVDLAFGS